MAGSGLLGQNGAIGIQDMVRNETERKLRAGQTAALSGGVQNTYTSTPISSPQGYEKELKSAQEAYTRQAVAGLEGAYRKSLTDLDSAEAKVAPQFQEARNQAAGTNAQEKRAFAEYAVGHGLNSGAGGQAELARSATLQNTMGSINRGEADKMADLAAQRAKLGQEYQFAVAQAQAQGDAALAEKLYTEWVRQDEAARAVEQYNNDAGYRDWYAGRALGNDDKRIGLSERGMVLEEQSRLDSLAQNALNNQRYQAETQESRAWAMAERGDFSGLRAMGIDTSVMERMAAEDRQLAIAAQRASMAARSGGGGGGSAAPVVESGLTYNQMLSAIDAGLRDTPAVQEAMKRFNLLKQTPTQTAPVPDYSMLMWGAGTGEYGPIAQKEDGILRQLANGEISAAQARTLGQRFGLLR